jgi:hypothetical protein
MLNWHGKLLTLLKSESAFKFRLQHSTEMGRFPLSRRANTDQVPLAFGDEAPSTLADKGSTKVQVSAPGTSKYRFCTLAPTIFADGTGLRNIAVIFQGTGAAEKKEKSQYHHRVHVFWQPKAWADEAQCLSQAKRGWAQHVRDHPGEYLHFFDNLGGQVTPTFIEAMKELDTVLWWGPAGLTEFWYVRCALSLGAAAVLHASLSGSRLTPLSARCSRIE